MSFLFDCIKLEIISKYINLEISLFLFYKIKKGIFIYFRNQISGICFKLN